MADTEAPSNVRGRRLGRLAADERAANLCDPGTFVAEHRARASAFADVPPVPPGDGIVIGTGLVNGRPVTVIATDGRVHRGALGSVGAGLAARATRDAARAGRPVALLIDADGARAAEGPPAVLATADWLAALAETSGHVPLVTAVFGFAGGAAAYGAALTDLVVMVAERSFAFVAGPPVVQSALSETSDLETLGGTRLHFETTGLAHALAPDDRAALAWIGKTLDYLPGSAWTLPPRTPTREPAVDTFTPGPPDAPWDSATAIAAIVDRESYLSIGAGFGPCITTGFARIDGRPIALVASQPLAKGGAIDHQAAQKLARFVRLAAAFNLPVITLCDTPGFMPGRAEEAARILVHGAKVISAYAEARRSVPLVAVVLRRSVGAGTVLAYGADLVLACPASTVQQMGSAAAIDAEQAGLAHRTILPHALRAELVRALAVLRPPTPSAPGLKKSTLIPI